MNALFERIRQQPWAVQAIERWQALSRRDQLALGVLGAFLGGVLLYGAIWSPITSFHARALDDWQRQDTLLTWMQQNESAARTAASVPQPQVGTSERPALLAVAANGAREIGLKLDRSQPDANGRLSVTLESAEFDRLATWLVTMHQRYGVMVSQASFERQQQPGVVNARVILRYPG